MRKFLREPFVHFVFLGGLLFAGHTIWQRNVTKVDRTIFVSPAEMERQGQIFATENRRQPTDGDMEALLFAHVEEQVLMREAQRLGLDADDTIIRRRLAQKMRFMIDDVTSPSLPKRDELQSWYDANSAEFLRPETRSFEHIYLSPKNRKDTVIAEAEALLSDGVGTDWENLGDAFITGRSFTSLAAPAVQRDFGIRFSKSLFALPNNRDWQGPLNSAFGPHLVRVTAVAPEKLPAFEDILPEVEAVWREQAKRAANKEALKTLILKYKIEIDE